jgi:IMP cyclohydrolase
MSDLRDRAEATFARHLDGNPYPGRGLVLGRSEDGAAWLQLYWIMGRSANSRNRVFVADGGTLRTEPFDAAAVEDPSLILYEAMLEGAGAYVVSNGDQTRTVYDALARGGSFEAALETREREPDAPNFTPRISGLIDLRSPAPCFALSILKANKADPERTDRTAFRPAPPPPGFGLGLTTYRGDGSPLPSFEGEPLCLPLTGAPEALLERYWGALDAGNRVALALKRIPLRGGRGTLLVRNLHAR